MRQFIDISIPLKTGMVAWPGSIGFTLSQTMKMSDGAHANNSKIVTDVHIGTHIDAPWHSIVDGATVESLSLADLIGQAYVAYLPDADVVTAAALENAGIPKNVERLLLRTRNSEIWKSDSVEFRKDFVGLIPEASEWLVNRRIRLVGIDYLSVQKFTEKTMLTHDILLKKNIVVVEGLNLSGVDPGFYELICLPLKIVGSEGAPARAVLRRLDGSGKSEIRNPKP